MFVLNQIHLIMGKPTTRLILRLWIVKIASMMASNWENGPDWPWIARIILHQSRSPAIFDPRSLLFIQYSPMKYVHLTYLQPKKTPLALCDQWGCLGGGVYPELLSSVISNTISISRQSQTWPPTTIQTSYKLSTCQSSSLCLQSIIERRMQTGGY